MRPVCRADSTRVSDQEDWVDAFNLPAPPAAPQVQRFQRIQRWRWNELREKLAYRYFCWRSVHEVLWPIQKSTIWECWLPC